MSIQSTSSDQKWFHRKWPLPAVEHNAEQFLKDCNSIWNEHNQYPDILEQSDVIDLIKAIGGNSSYLASLVLKHVDFFESILYSNPYQACHETLQTLITYPFQSNQSAIRRIMRITKQKIALCCAIADIGNLWSLEQVTSTLSLLAEYSLQLAINHLLFQAHTQHKLKLSNTDDPSEKSGLIILAMGKLGAKELNYSSDIDLIILYDPDRHNNREDLSTFFVRMTRQLISLMEERDENGYVFRTDLRLRPDPSSSPLAVSLLAAVTYYESLGETWERNAMSKARPIAGDLEAGYNFLEMIRPFIWRRHLDFSIIDDIHAIKKRIDQHKNFDKEDLSNLSLNAEFFVIVDWLLGQNIKLGQGGIREIEFCAQTLQLIWGGRYPELQDVTTVGALKKFASKALFSQEKTTILINAYHFLRKVEHRIQMKEDQQTHNLPSTQNELTNLSIFLDYTCLENFALELYHHMHQVHEIFKNEFSTPENEEQSIFDLPSEQLKKYLKAKNLPIETEPFIQSWNYGRLKTLKNPRARALLSNILPLLLEAFSQQNDPLLILKRFDNILDKHRAGTQFLSLLERNPNLITRLSQIIGISPFIADYVANNPSAIDVLLEANILKTKLNLKNALHNYLDKANTYSEAMPALHTLIHGEEFRISVAEIENQTSLNQASIFRTSMANAIMVALLKKIFQEHKAKYGEIPGGDICIIVLGKAGSWEMAFGSDLDLMLIYDHPDTITESVHLVNQPSNHKNTLRTLAANQYYVRLTQNFISALTSPGISGSLYEVDMRLRPSGSKGPVAVSLTFFIKYHKEDAWTWERMALTRARVIGGSFGIRRKVSDAIIHALTHAPHHKSNPAILDAVRKMRQRLIKEAPPSSYWDIKHRTGGLMEVEFIAQGLQLIVADHQFQHPCTRFALKRLTSKNILTPTDAEFLIYADEFWRKLQSLLRIFFGRNPPSNLTNKITGTILEIMVKNLTPGEPLTQFSLQKIEEKVDHISQKVRTLFNDYIGHID